MNQQANIADRETAPAPLEVLQSTPISSDGPPLAVGYRKTGELKPYQANARTHSKAQIRKIAESIRSFGFTNPVLIDAQDRIVAGHGRVQAAKLLKMTTVPTIRLESLTPAQVRAYVLADNRLAEDAGWDQEILKIELQNIILESEIDVSLTGFEIGEIDLIIGQVGDSDPDDEISEVREEAVSRPGDLWLLGPHRLYCGDARSEASFSTLMGDTRASVVYCDIPFNVPIHGHASGNGKTHHPEFAMASGEMNEEESPTT
jgi:ParB-like nuclease domain